MDSFEHQCFENQEEDSETFFAKCKKNPGHHGFIPINSFGMQHLPLNHRDPKVLKLIGLVALITVKIESLATCPLREVFFPGQKTCCNRNARMTGSGRVYHATKYVKGLSDNVKHPSGRTTCQCRRCFGTASPSDTWWEIAIITASHLVCDYLEAKETKCYFFDDKDPNVDFESVVYVNVEEDKCILNCITCDDTLGDIINKSVNKILLLWSKLHIKYKESKDLRDFSFIVSHPHGAHKHVTIGKCLEKVQLPECEFGCYFSYTTPTCPGCSGAIVYLLGYSGTAGWSTQPVHSRTLGGVNISGVGYVK
ncbi:hypothetical protein BgiBS90_028232 [Biomphalaria glabrata]|nr:hypothetical protein BgiBS90_028232 [Biomphalaria glabrata]